jgi:pimeloyl-ACP methyl ester carboxylesterase
MITPRGLLRFAGIRSGIESSERRTFRGSFPSCASRRSGRPARYLEPLEAMASGGRRVIFYDQLDVGLRPPEGSRPWTVPLFVEELGAVRTALGLDASIFSVSRGAACSAWSTR